MGFFDRLKKKDKPEEGYLTFDHAPFKLAVMQVLMYDQALLGDKYTGGDGYFERYADAAEVSEEESLKRLEPCIEAGMRFFRDFPVPRSLAERVTRLYLGEENEIYYQINPQWEDFDEYFEDGRAFDITDISEREIRQFPNLKAIVFNLYHEPPEELVRKLESWGIEVTFPD